MMDNYIRVYDNVMDDEKCQHLIDMFESDAEHHEIQDNGNGATLHVENSTSFCDFNSEL